MKHRFVVRKKRRANDTELAGRESSLPDWLMPCSCSRDLLIGISVGGSIPCVPPHVGVPATLVHFNQIKISNHSAVVFQPVLFDHFRDEPVGLIVPPAALAQETVVNENLLAREAPAIFQTLVEYLFISFACKYLCFDIVVAD